MKSLKASIGKESYYYYGSPFEKKRKSIIIFFSSEVEKRYLKSVIKTAVEASLHGYDIITNGIYSARRSICYPVLRSGRRISVVLNPRLENFSLSLEDRFVLLSGGSFISFTDERKYSKELLLRSNIRMLDLSERIIFAGRAYPNLAREALDKGMDVAVLRDFLYEEDNRALVREGAACIDTFSSWLTLPSFIAYEQIKEGKESLKILRIP